MGAHGDFLHGTDYALEVRYGKQRIFSPYVQERSSCFLLCLERRKKNLCSLEMG